MSDDEPALPEVVGRHLTPDEARLVADELRRLGYVVTAPKIPAWLIQDDDGMTMLGRGMDDPE